VGLALGVTRAAAQVSANRSTAYLVPTDVTDARALWVNPAGPAVRHEASVMLDLTVVQPGGRGRLEQITTGFSSHGLSFGYQRDNFGNGLHGHTYRLGIAGSSGGLAAGVALAFYRGSTGGTGWDIGMRYDWKPPITLGAVIENIGRPTVRGVPRDVTVVPAITMRPLTALLAFSAQGAFTTAATRGYALQASAQLPGQHGLALVGRLDTDRSWRRRALTFGLSLGRSDRVGVVGSTPGDFSRIDTASLYGVSSRTAGR
jgi:hypothetical protein